MADTRPCLTAPLVWVKHQPDFMHIQIKAAGAARRANPQHGLLFGIGKQNAGEIILRLGESVRAVAVFRPPPEHADLWDDVPYHATRQPHEMDDVTLYEPFNGEIVISS